MKETLREVPTVGHVRLSVLAVGFGRDLYLHSIILIDPRVNAMRSPEIMAVVIRKCINIIRCFTLI